MSDEIPMPSFQRVGQAESDKKAAARQRFVSTVRQTWIANGGDPKLFEPSWNDFTQTTTFHGVRFIFDPNALRMRRVLWVLCVVAAITTFVIQVGMRAGDYFQYHTNVEVQVVYTDSVTFPAVTICNHNNFRLTKTQEFGLYGFIDYVYKTENISDQNLTAFGADSVDTESFVVETAHQLTDFIDSCRWKGVPCNAARDFLLTHTDMGVCYTFNAGREREIMEVTEPGAGFALSMILNIEQYEYSRGPHNDAGVKILLHDQSEFPMIQDLGFAVAPGTHTLVGVHRSVSEGMEEPYGSCDKLSNVSMSDCLLKCRTREITNICGCRAVYTEDSNTPVCNMTSYFGCALEVIDAMEKSSKSCNCVVPCRRVTYEPSLSYAHLSKYNIDRAVLSEKRQEYVKGQFLTAKETFQRADAIKQAQNEKSQTRINNTLNNLRGGLSAAAEFYTDQAPLGLRVLLHKMKTSLEEDRATIIRVGSYNEMTFSNKISMSGYDMIDVQLGGLYTLYGVPQKGALWPNAYKNMFEELIKCSESLTFPQNVTHFLSVYRKSTNPLLWSVCDKTLYGSMRRITANRQGIAVTKNKLSTLEHDYPETVREIFNNTNFDLSSRPEHNQCLDKLNQTIRGEFALTLDKIDEILSETASVDTVVELYNLSLQMREILNASEMLNYRENIDELYGNCSWYSQYMTNKLLNDIENDWTKAADNVQMVESLISNLADKVLLITTSVTSRLVPTLECMERYSNYEIDKQELYRCFHSFRMQKAVLDTQSFAMDYDFSYEHFTTAFSQMTGLISTALDRVLSCQVPILNNQQIADLEWLVLISEHTSKPFGAHLQNLRGTSNFADAVNDLTEDFLKQMIVAPHEELRLHLIDTVTKFMFSIDYYQNALKEYNQECQMDETFFKENFLQVDIFYKELKYERVVQRPAFQTLSLLSEVGGFLGLLLGASVLTVCELVDYLIMTFTKKLRQNKGTTNP